MMMIVKVLHAFSNFSSISGQTHFVTFAKGYDQIYGTDNGSKEMEFKDRAWWIRC